MRRIGSLVLFFGVLVLLGCQPPAASPAPVSDTPSADGKGAPATWEDTNLPASSAPGMSSDDSPGQRADAQKATDPNAPHVVPMVTPAPLRAGISQTTVVEGLQLPVA